MESWPAATYRARVEVRHRIGAMLLLALLVTIAVGGVLGSAIGDRRNATAFDRYVHDGGGPDLLITPGQGDDTGPGVQVAKVRAIPGVLGASEVAAFAAMAAPKPGVQPQASWTFEMEGPTDERLLRDQMRPILLAGRLADPHVAQEAIVNAELAKRYRVGVGDHFAVQTFLTPDDEGGTRMPFLVTGIVRFPDEALQAQNEREAVLFTSLAFVRAHRHSIAYHLVATDLADPVADSPAVRQAVTDSVAGSKPGFATVTQRRSNMRLATCAVNSTLIVFGLVFGLLCLIVVSQTLRRMSQARAADDAVLSALGASTGTRLLVALSVPMVGIAFGLVGGAVLATAISARFPVGIARRAELHPGLAVNWAWTFAGLGIAAVTLGTLAAAVTWQSVNRSSRRVAPHRPVRLPGMLWRVGLPLAVVEGTRRALSLSPGRDSTRRGIVGVALGVAGIVLAVVFLANAQALVQNPDRFGWAWTEMIELRAPAGSSVVHRHLEAASADPAVAAVAGFSPLPFLVDGVRIPGVAVTQGPVPMPVELVHGTVPHGRSQVALGGLTMRRLGVDLGDTVRLGVPGGTRSVSAEVVGEAVFPSIGVELMADTTGLGSGVYVPFPTATRITPAPQTGVAVRFTPGASAAARRAALAPFEPAIRRGQAFRVSGVQRPDNVVALAEIGPLPGVLVGSLALVVVAEFALTLVSAARSRRRDLAVLKSMGFVRRQLVGLVLWEGVVAAAVATFLGAVVGVALGRYAWLIMTGDLAIADTTVTPLASVGMVGLAVVVGTALVGVVPAWLAARRPVATELASE